MYNNRLHCGCHGSTEKTTTPSQPVEEEKKSEVVTPVVPAVSMNTVPCCKPYQISSITRVGNKVIVTFNDCTYLEASKDVVDPSVGEEATEDLTNKLQQLQNTLTALEAKLAPLQEKVDGIDLDAKADKEEVTKLKDAHNLLVRNLIVINTLSDDPSYKAFNKTFEPTEI